MDVQQYNISKEMGREYRDTYLSSSSNGGYCTWDTERGIRTEAPCYTKGLKLIYYNTIQYREIGVVLEVANFILELF